MYKYEVGFVDGYRIGGWDSHWKNVKDIKDFNSIKIFLERCPEDCNCGLGEKGLFY
jgi:hypothetical protein